MVKSFIVFFIALIIRITLGSLTSKFQFLRTWITCLNCIVIGCAVIFIITVVINIINAKKK